MSGTIFSKRRFCKMADTNNIYCSYFSKPLNLKTWFLYQIKFLLVADSKIQLVISSWLYKEFCNDFEVFKDTI